MKLFGPERFGMFLRGWPEEEAIEHRIVTSSLERAQQKVEMRNFEIRKNTLQYDDVMDKQRSIIYEQRRRVLEGEDIREHVLNMLERTVDTIVDAYASPDIHPEDRDLEMLYTSLVEAVPAIDSIVASEDLYAMAPDRLADELHDIIHKLYREREAIIGPELLRDIERSWLLRVVDTWWMAHLQEMDHLRDSISLRGYGQRDPLVEYQKEAYDYFEGLVDHIAGDMTKAIMMTETSAQQQERDTQELETSTGMLEPALVAAGAPAEEGPEGDSAMAEAAEQSRGVARTYRAQREPGRNDPCPCGSGKKYKKCCMLKK